jgi:K+-sensing histidine kinase KdpD
MNEGRPDPDQLLQRVREEEERKREGQLKIFFGAAPGVGKTYAMLEAARQKKREGVEIVVGLVETHGRKETEALGRTSTNCSAPGGSCRRELLPQGEPDRPPGTGLAAHRRPG